MGNVRTSNKDILAAIEAQTSAINGLVGALTGTQVQAQAPAVETPAATESNGHEIPKGYMETMDKKVRKLVGDDGQSRVLYLRRNLKGEYKLAYALKSRWDEGIKDNGLIGAVKVYS